jgi:23S rRNA (guanine2445-N2)-methyltransferase / 23S rRNA (guanine2069-N7)-methyltransferase
MSGRWFATCPKGLEGLLAAELAALGAGSTRETVAGVAFEGPADLGYRACLWSRFASRVLLPLAEFPVDGPDALYRGMRAIDWTQHLAADGRFAIDAGGRADGLVHSQFVALKSKDAIVDQFREAGGTRPDVDLERPDLRIDVRLKRGQATVSIDLSGTPLHQRGWRVGQGAAPLKENLAAAMLVRAGWPAIHAAGGPLVDPFCGSGTLLIEGAQMAADVAPGLARERFGFHGWRGFDIAAWTPLRAEAEARAAVGLRALEPIYFGFDPDPAAINLARVNAQRAGVAGFLTLAVRPVMALEPPPHRAPGLVICNPPYGERIGEVAALKLVYAAFGAALKRGFAGWRAALITSRDELGFATGLKAERRYALMNGAIECRLLCFDDIRAEGSAPLRELKPLGEGAQGLANRIARNVRHLKRWREREGITCWRAYDADLPEYSAAIDVYSGVREGDPGDTEARIWLHVQEYRAPKEIPAETAARRLKEVLRVAAETFAVPRERIALKQRRPQARDERYERFDARGEFLIVREGGLQFRVNLHDWLDTGLFLDHRPMRLRIGKEARGKRFLNLFAYTGAATVHAAAGGAVSTTTVDLSQTYLDWASRNLSQNGIVGRAHALIQADVMTWLAADRGRYDLIFIDPPTFSNSKRAEDFDVQRDHPHLLQLAMARLAPDGLLLFSNNLRRFRLDPAVAEACTVRDITRATIPPDFERDARIHHAFEVRHRHGTDHA